MSDADRIELADKLERGANMLLCDSIPEPWPAWMTVEKRQSMSARFREYAAELRA